jgi:hypothetical protein
MLPDRSKHSLAWPFSPGLSPRFSQQKGIDYQINDKAFKYVVAGLTDGALKG